MTKVKLTVRIDQDGNVSYRWEPATPIPDQTTLEILSTLIRKYQEDVKDGKDLVSYS